MSPRRHAQLARLRELARTPAWRDRARRTMAANWRDPQYRERVRRLRKAEWRSPAWRESWLTTRREMIQRTRLTFDEMMARYVRPEPGPNGCWQWVGSFETTGYGRARPLKGHAKISMAHRLVYEHLKGPIPADWHVHHHCGVRSCVRPDHLEPMPAKIHILYTFADRRGRSSAPDDDDDSVSMPPSPAVPDEPALTCLCGRTRGVFAAACCDEGTGV
jgi:hypothetical protein